MGKLFEFTQEYEGEELRDGSSEIRRKRSHKGLIVAVVLLIVVGAVVAAAYMIRIERIDVAGNEHCNRDVVINKVLPEEEDRRLIFVLYKMVTGVPLDGAFSSLKIELTGVQSVRITVKESPAMAQLPFGDRYVFLNEGGYVVGSLPVRDSVLPCLSGDLIRGYEEFEFPDTQDGEALKEAVKVAEKVRAYEVDTRDILCRDRTYTLVIGDVLVSIGRAEDLDQKLQEVNAQVAAYRGLSGTLHMETWDEADPHRVFIFEVAQ